MNREEMQQRLESIENEAAKIRHALAEKEWVCPVFDAPFNTTFLVGQMDSGTMSTRKHEPNTMYPTNPAFRDEQSASAFAEAFQVMLELRACEGVVPAKHNKWLWVAVTESGDIRACLTPNFGSMLAGCFAPCFDTKEHAQAAINKVGEDRILRAIKTLVFAKE